MNQTVSQQTILRGQHSIIQARERAELRRRWANRMRAVGIVVAAFVLWWVLR